MCCAAILPPAPALFSTTTDWPRFSLSFCAMIRAAKSAPPPGAKPTVKVTARLGKDCPPTAPAKMRAVAASIVRVVSVIRILSEYESWHEMARSGGAIGNFFQSSLHIARIPPHLFMLLVCRIRSGDSPEDRTVGEA